jgi:hypothetical protein
MWNFSRVGQVSSLIILVAFPAFGSADELVLTNMNFVGVNDIPPSGFVPVRVLQQIDGWDPIWTNDVSSASVGLTFTMTRQSIGDPIFYRFNHFLFNEPDNLQVLAPNGGHGFPPPDVDNYHLSRMTLSIDDWVPMTPTTRIYYTLNVYGEPGTVPEPSIGSLIVLGFVSLFLYSSRCRAEN